MDTTALDALFHTRELRGKSKKQINKKLSVRCGSGVLVLVRVIVGDEV